MGVHYYASDELIADSELPSPFWVYFNSPAHQWLGGFKSILKCLTPGNFNWFLHTMLFYHTRHVLEIQRQKEKRQDQKDSIEDDNSDEENEQLVARQRYVYIHDFSNKQFDKVH